MRDEFAQFRFDLIQTPLRGEAFGLRGVPGADRFEYRAVAQVEEVVDLAVGVRVRPAHEAVANKSDVELFHFLLLIAVSVVFPNYTRRQKTRRVRARGLQEFVGRVP